MKTILFILTALLAGSLGACMKQAAGKTNTQATNGSSTVYYNNSKSALYVVEFINLDTRKVFTTVLTAGRKNGAMTVPDFLTTGYYDIVLTPENGYETTTTQYAVGGVSGTTNTYPATVKNAYITINSPGTIAISLQ